MCGIVGFLGSVGSAGQDVAVVRRMADTLRHRGPDDDGVWVGRPPASRSHRRLSIVDLSPAGHQPMLSASRRYVIVFNGEIYNYEELRRTLEREHGARLARPFRHRGDAGGVRALGHQGRAEARSSACSRSRCGTAASARCVLARDRLGEKPLYYGWIGATLCCSARS